jgi:hypothetical protein
VLEAEAIPLESHPELHSSSLQPSSVDDKENEKNFPTTSKTCLEIQSSGIIDQTDGDTSLRHASSSTSPVSPALSSSSAFTIPNYTKTISKSASSLYLPRGRKSFVYVGFMREHPIPPSLETEWVKVIRVRLVKDLIPVVQGLPRTLCRKDKVIEPELCMAGELKKGSQDVHLKPTVWIRCGSKKCREKVKAAVDDLSYLRSFSRGTVQVGLHAPRAAGKDSEESENGSYYEQQNEMTLIVEQISNSSSACGLRLQILTSNYEKITTRFATIGGLIQVNGAVYGLTTAHSLIPEKAFDNDETGISSDARSEESESDLESLATSTESFARAEKAPQDNSIYTGATIRIGDPRLGPFSFASSGTDIVGSDFALIELGIGLGAHDFLRNEYILDNAGDVPPIQINTWEGKDDEPFVGQVHIICAFQDVREGFLLKEKSLFIQEGAVFHTRKIQMSQPLGTWFIPTFADMITNTY